jgi:hypothetical protein
MKAEDLIQDTGNGFVSEAALIAVAQRIERYNDRFLRRRGTSLMWGS